jgi:hypothetical protein
VPGLSCGDVRRYLAGVAANPPRVGDVGLFTALQPRGAVQGTADRPEITPVGRHVLQELEVRAYRADTLPLDTIADQLGRVLGDLDAVAKRAEYFLADLGPVTPPEALPMLRPVAVGLANRRETPEELAEEFRNVWGSVEVMGGDSRDRLLAAALLHAGDVAMDKIYSPMMTTTATIREIAGPRAPAVTVAALLHLGTADQSAPRIAEYTKARATTRTEEGAAVLAATGRPIDEVLAARAAWLAQLAHGSPPTADDQVAAGYLVAVGARIERELPRVRALTSALADRFQAPVVAAAILSTVDWLEPGELMNWLDKATEIARQRKLAPTPRELAALGLGMVIDLPTSEFSATTVPPTPLLTRLASTVAVNAWVYGELIPPAAAPPAVAAG